MTTLKGAHEMPIGGLIPEGGTSRAYHTGSWASQQPKVDSAKCTGCMFCVNYCPDDCMVLGTFDGKLKVASIRLEYCKGCGVCQAVCKFQAMVMAKL